MRITFVVGLPGSGKSHWARQAAAAEGASLVDDPRSPEELEAALARGGSLYVVDPMLCLPERRAGAEAFFRSRVPEAELRWVYFAPEPEACRLNLASRQAEGDARAVLPSLALLSRFYQIPEGGEVLPVWRGRSPGR